MANYLPFPTRYYSLLEREAGSVLLQTSRFDEDNYRSYLFIRPSATFSVSEAAEIPQAFSSIERAIREGKYVAGFVSYDCGAYLQGIKSRALTTNDMPLAWFAVYSAPYAFNHITGSFEGDAPDSYLHAGSTGESFEIQRAHLSIAPGQYIERIEKIKEYIGAGHTYQVNFTDKLGFDFAGSAVAMFAALIERQHVSYSAFLNLGDRQILSFSPELFFRIRDGKITTRPMKGTARRGRYLAEDCVNAQWLQNDTKNRSENVMIVDLLRNDLGRICEFGSISVAELFAVEKYETLFQMTSAISGTLKAGVTYYEIFQSLFPCGSVTGAPKIRTMEIIRELECRPRSVYTGAIGFFSPNDECVFNVAIRTAVLNGAHGEMGVGSGIVIDSSAEDEYSECVLKAEFLATEEPSFQLIETMLWDRGYRLLPLHLERLQASAGYFEFGFDQNAISAQLRALERNLRHGLRYKVRLSLEKAGALTVRSELLDEQSATGKVTLSPIRTSSRDRFLYHKTTRRGLYDEQYKQARLGGYDDTLFLNERDEITEGAISNVLVQKDGGFYTPPMTCGLLPGIYRRHLLETRAGVEEKVLHLSDLQSADSIYLCNAIRGLRRVELQPGSSQRQ